MNKYSEIYSAFALIKNPLEAKQFLEDILTPNELNSIAERLQIYKMLAQGTTQRNIRDNLKTSISKVTRGAAAWRRSPGGVRTLLRRMGYLRDPK